MEGIRLGYVFKFITRNKRNIFFKFGLGYYWGSGETIEYEDRSGLVKDKAFITRYEFNFGLLRYFEKLKIAIGIEYSTITPVSIKVIFKWS